MTYDLNRTIMELEAELRNAHPDERQEIKAELEQAQAELALLCAEVSDVPPF